MDDVVLHGDVYAGLGELEDESIAVAITSPPYWRQRDYGFEGQIGQEQAPEEYIGRLVAVFRRLRRKLRRDGVFFLNVGDKYLQRYGKGHLLQIPYRLAHHMVRDGWVLLDVLIWYKPNHMPSPVRDRFANTYEPVLVLARDRGDNLYAPRGSVLKIPLQQTPWKHTAVFPERLVEELLSRTRLRDGDAVLDPFAGTGTVGAVVRRMRRGLFPLRLRSVMIEKGSVFIDIIRERLGQVKVVEVGDEPYAWRPVVEERLPRDLEPLEVLQDRHGEVFIARDSGEFQRALKGVVTGRFRSYHREDALFFYGVRNWGLRDLYLPHALLHEGYVLRNMLVVSRGGGWYPVFMFARDTTRVEYKFYLDRVRVAPKTRWDRDWRSLEFTGLRVRDSSGKTPRVGRVVKVLERYGDGFPRIVVVRWDGTASAEIVLHPRRDELVMEGLVFKCPRCGSRLEEPYDPVGENRCPSCGALLWETLDTLPLVEEPPEVREALDKLGEARLEAGEELEIGEFEERRRATRSKFVGLDRINWGASPGARKLMLGEYFTKMRLYRVDQPTVAQYLNVLRRARGLTLRDVVERMPPGYEHTVGHWFRKDFGGSVPVPEDIPHLRRVLGDHPLLTALERTILKFQTVKASVKGKNPGDFIEGVDGEPLVLYLKKLYLPPQRYIKLILESRV